MPETKLEESPSNNLTITGDPDTLCIGADIRDIQPSSTRKRNIEKDFKKSDM